MQHSLHIEGFGIRLRPVRMSDAEMIVWLRNQDYVRGKLGDSATTVAAQEAWLAEYFARPNDYYFMIETLAGTPVGTHGLYHFSGTTAESGRFTIRPDVVAAVPSSILAFDLAFERLQLLELVALCVATNHGIHSLNRKFGFKQDRIKPDAITIGGKSADLIRFSLQAADWRDYRERLIPLAEFAEERIRCWDESRIDGRLMAREPAIPDVAAMAPVLISPPTTQLPLPAAPV